MRLYAQQPRSEAEIDQQTGGIHDGGDEGRGHHRRVEPDLLRQNGQGGAHQLGAGHQYQRITLPQQRQKIREKLQAGSFYSPMSAISPHENTPQCGGALDSQRGKNCLTKN